MTVLSCLQEACPFIGLAVPSAVMSATDRDSVELKAVANDMADKIAKAYGWQKFATLKTHTGDGSTEDFDLPDDYDWMPDDRNVWTSDNNQPLCKVASLDDWLGQVVRDWEPVPGNWIIYGDQIHIRTALGSGITAKYYYQSNLIIAPAYLLSFERWPFHTEPPDHFALLSHLLDMFVSQSSTLVPMHSAHGYQSC